MADNLATEGPSSPPHVRNRHVLWWTGGAVLLIALVAIAWLERKRIHWSLPKWTTSPPEWLLPLGLVAGGLLALAILWKVPQWQVRRVRRLNAKERFDRVNEARKTLATVLGGIAFLVGGFFTWQSLNVARENLRVSQEGQITDRFSKAIEQLGAVDASGKKKLEVRLGGIYALEGIANESKELHWPIMEVLCTYVRENAPAPLEEENPLGEDQKSKKPAQNSQASTPAVHPTADIQAILTVLGRRDRTHEREEQHLNLYATDLRGADLYKADLSRAILSIANLSWANLVRADLVEADLMGANLRVASLIEANLSRTMLGGTDLSDALLIEAHLISANLEESNLRHAVLRDADLSGADLRWARLERAYLRDARNLTQEQIDKASGDSTTQLPAGRHMPESWKKK